MIVQFHGLNPLSGKALCMVSLSLFVSSYMIPFSFSRSVRLTCINRGHFYFELTKKCGLNLRPSIYGCPNVSSLPEGASIQVEVEAGFTDRGGSL